MTRTACSTVVPAKRDRKRTPPKSRLQCSEESGKSRLFKIVAEPAGLTEDVRQKRQRDYDRFPVLSRLLLTRPSAELAVDARDSDIPVYGVEVALDFF